MKGLITGTAAFKAFSGDVAADRISHAYMLHFEDAVNLRRALKIFALEFFGVTENDPDGKRILNETFPDLIILPEEGKKFNAEAAASLLADSVLKPLERDRKLFVICKFDDAAPIIQNKLLKTLEEPSAGVHFLLGATSLAPVLDTVKSRVKTLTVPPFSRKEILGALERRGGNPLNEKAAQSCGGILGVAQNMVDGGWFAEVEAAAAEICSTDRVGDVGGVALKYGDTKYKQELLNAMVLNYRNALADGGGVFERPALMYAVKCADKANRDLKFNAFFQGLLYDLMLRVIEENDKWLKLRG